MLAGAQYGAASVMCACLMVPIGPPIWVSVILAVLTAAAIGLILGLTLMHFRICTIFGVPLAPWGDTR